MKEGKGKKNLVKAGILLGIGALGAVGIYSYLTRPVEYQVTSIHSGDLERKLSATGEILTEESKIYYATVDAPISFLEVDEGDIVGAGDKLVEFDIEDLTLNQKKAELQVSQAESSYQSTVSQNEKNTLLYEGAVITEAMFCEKISEQWELIEQLRKKIAETEVKANDISWLTSRAALDTDEDDRSDFAAGIDAWRREYDAMNVPQLQAELAKQQAIYSDMQAFRAQYASQRENADARLIDENAQKEILLRKQEAKVQKEDIENSLEDAQAGIYSSFHGIVREKFVQSGATVRKGDPLFQIDNLNMLYVSAEISKYDISQVAVGQKAQIDIGNENYQGVVTQIDRIALENSTDKAKIPVRVGFLGDTSKVCLGIEAEVTIELETCEDAQLLDRYAVYEDEKGNYVYVIKDGSVEKKWIEIGKNNEEKYQILGGIDETDCVITGAVTDAAIGTAAKAKQSGR